MPHAIKGVLGAQPPFNSECTALIIEQTKNLLKGVQHRTHRCMVQVMHVDIDDI